jgi:uncharacterized membrane protein YdbT with pleckstrin-like domain
MQEINAKISLIHYSFGWIVLGILTLPFGFGFIFLIFGPLYGWWVSASNRLRITDKSVEFRLGVLSRSVTSIALRRVESIELQQGLWGRMFNYGRLRFSGTGTRNEYSPWIKNPAAVKTEVENRMAALS